MKKGIFLKNIKFWGKNYGLYYVVDFGENMNIFEECDVKNE